MPSNRSLTIWAPKTYGFLMNGEPEYYGFFMEWTLNAMVMLTGSGNGDRWDSTVLPAGASDYYGCSQQFTLVRPEIWAILGATLLILIIFLVLNLFFALVHLFQQKHDHREDLAEAIPASFAEWQLALLSEATNDKTIKAAQMRHYSYGWDSVKGKFLFDNNKVFQGISFSPVVLQMSSLSVTGDTIEQVSFLKSDTSYAAA